MKRLLLFLLLFVSGMLLFSWVASWVGIEEIIRAARTVSWWYAAAIAAVTVCMISLEAFRWKVVLGFYGHAIPWPSLMKLYIAAFPFVFFVPMAAMSGELFRAYAIRERFSVPFEKGVASVIAERILEITTQFFFVILGLIVLFFQFPEWSRFIGMVIGFLSIVGAGMVWFYFRSFQGKSVISLFIPGKHKKLQGVESEVTSFFTWKSETFRKGALLTICRSALAFLRVWLLVVLLVGPFSVIAALPILGLSYIAIALPIPAALGTHDALQIFAFQQLGFQASEGLVFAMVIRVAEFLIALAGAAMLAVVGVSLLKKVFLRKIDKIFFNK